MGDQICSESGMFRSSFLSWRGPEISVYHTQIGDKRELFLQFPVVAKIIYIYQRRDGGHIGGLGVDQIVSQIDGEFMDVVVSGNHIVTLILTKRLGQLEYLRDCSAVIDRVQRQKDSNRVGFWVRTIGKNDWAMYNSFFYFRVFLVP